MVENPARNPGHGYCRAGAGAAIRTESENAVHQRQRVRRCEPAADLVEVNLIKEVSTAKIDAPGATVIDGGGRTLMPGLIDAHWHTMFNFWPISKVMSANFGGLSIAAAKHSGEQLLRGFTTVRDVGGNVFGVKMAIDSRLVDGPRIYPFGPYISQTSGH
jgi:imidazolonepropionase-like amidohydrolase